MNLIIDVGNSFVKLAVFKAETIMHQTQCATVGLIEVLYAIKKEYSCIDYAIISSVGRLPKNAMALIESSFKVLILNASIKYPFINTYETPETLGVDRLALVAASVKKYPNKNVLIIDAGTCITYDFINEKNEYLGGAISPGLQMRYQALNGYTANLPLLEFETPNAIIGTSTKKAMHSGVVYGVLNEIDGAVSLYSLKYSDLTVILTGGNTKFLSKQLKSSIFALPNFLLEGLNYILQINTNE